MVKQPLTIALIAGEASGDQLGFKLMQAVRELHPDCRFIGVGGDRMREEGLNSLFPMSDIAVMGILPVLGRLPLILRRIKETADFVISSQPDALVIIDSPDFTHRVARKVRQAKPDIPIINDVSPTVWAWRPGRAARMRAYIDHVLALLPFEPEAHQRLGGPPCTYIGHPLIERLDELRPDAGEACRRASKPPIVLVLPGSRRGEIARLMAPFGEAIALLVQQSPDPIDFVLPAVSHLEGMIRAAMADWPVKPRLVLGEADKYAAFRTARCALAASGTVTLELALAGVPHVVGYRVSILEAQLRYLIKVSTIVLPNLILGNNAVPEFLQEACNGPALATALLPLLTDTPQRQAQLDAMRELDQRMAVPVPPSIGAAQIIDTLITR
jgi:lipid-A-disaccharide synthase